MLIREGISCEVLDQVRGVGSFFGFQSLDLPFDLRFWTRRLPFVMRSRKAGLPFPIRSWKRELCLQRDVSRMTRTENVLSQNFSKFFWNLILFMFHATLIIMSRKYFFAFRSPDLPFDIRFWTRGLPFVMRSRKAGLPFAIRARKRELCLQRYVSRMTRTDNFLSQSFSGNYFCSSFMLPRSL